MTYYVDIDETICKTPGDINVARDYSKAVPIKEEIEKINRLFDEGHTIIYWTSRGAGSGKDWYMITYRQLKEWGAKFHMLRTDKPLYDCIVDDKAKRIEEL
jgi:hypothetical protein